MIISKEVEVNISSKNINIYKNKGYENVLLNEKLIVKVEDVPLGSHVKIQVKCDICGTEKMLLFQKYNKNISKHNIYACSSKCSVSKNKKTCLENHGVEHPLQNIEIKNKLKKTNNERYGVDNVFQNNKIKIQIKKSNNIKYGVDYPQQNAEILEKSNTTNTKKYGHKRPSQSNIVKQKMVDTNIERYGTKSPIESSDIHKKILNTVMLKYGVKNVSESQIIKDKIKNTFFINNITKYKEKYNIDLISYDNDTHDYTIICKKCNNTFNINNSLLSNRIHTNSSVCTLCNPYNSLISDKEVKLLDFIKDNYNEKIIVNSRNIITPYELDIYLPDLNLAFEFNGLYWHSEIYKDKNYHKIKSDMCDEKGIQLIHIWEDNWDNKQEIVKSMILNKLGKTKTKLFGRKTIVKEVDNKLVRSFLEGNHIQGFVGSTVKIGLFYEDELVSLMTFGKQRKSMNSVSIVDGEYEMLRFCNKLNTNVIGGASKLFKYFLNNYTTSKIISYADRSHSNGNLYKHLGFNFIHITKPNYYYVVDNQRKYRFGFRKDILLKHGFDINKSEHEIMLERKIYRIYNAGNYKFSFILEQN